MGSSVIRGSKAGSSKECVKPANKKSLKTEEKQTMSEACGLDFQEWTASGFRSPSCNPLREH